MRPIDADAFREHILGGKPIGLTICQYSESDILEMIREQPTITSLPNDPLTLDELREMDGDPVFCRSLLTGKEGWAICRIAECAGKWYLAFSGGEQAYGDKDTIGRNWIAFRRKPEEGTT